MINTTGTLHQRITTRGQYQQEQQYLFAGLYGEKALTKRERGYWAQFENSIKAGKFRTL